MSPTPSRLRADVPKRRPPVRARLMSIYVAGATAYCAWAYPNERLIVTAAPMGPSIADLVDKLDSDTPVFLEEAAVEEEEIDFAASFKAYLPEGATPRGPRPAVPPSIPRNFFQVTGARHRSHKRRPS